MHSTKRGEDQSALDNSVAPLNPPDDKKEQGKSLINRFGVLDGSNNKPAKKFLMIGGAGGMSSMKE